MWSGVESIDTTYAGGPHNKIQKLPGTFNEKDKDDADPLRAQNFAFDHAFACMDKATGLFRTQMADGIMGMDNARESFWYQAYDNGMIEKKAFVHSASRVNLIFRNRVLKQAPSPWVGMINDSIPLPWFTQSLTWLHFSS